jgi:hypothetical protein
MVVETPFLQRMFIDEKIIIPEQNSSELISRASDVFKLWIDPDFSKWLDYEEGPSSGTEVAVYEQAKDANFKEMFYSLKYPMKDLYLKQSQLKWFCKNNYVYLRREGRSTFVPLRSETHRYYIANIVILFGGMFIDVFRFSTVTTKFLASRKNRIIVRMP